MGDPVHVQGLENLQGLLDQLPAKLREKTLAKAVSAGGAIMQAEMVARAPVRQDGGIKKLSKKSRYGRLPGFLKASIGRRRADRESPTTVSYIVGVLRRAFYANFLEFGTRHQAAQPFIRPAAEQTEGQVVDKIGSVIRTDVGKWAPEFGHK